MLHWVTPNAQATSQVKSAGGCSLGESLKVNNSLQELHLVSHVFLFSSLCCDCFVCILHLTHVEQGYNEVGDEGALGLGEGLKMNSSLQMLFLVSIFSSKKESLQICLCCYYFVFEGVALFPFGDTCFAGRK